MGRRSDPRRVLQAQLEGARMRLVDLDYRRDLTPAQRERSLIETLEIIARLESGLAE